MLTMVNPIDFGGHRSKVKVRMVIIDKCGVRGDATLCVVIFFLLLQHFVVFFSLFFHQGLYSPFTLKASILNSSIECIVAKFVMHVIYDLIFYRK